MGNTWTHWNGCRRNNPEVANVEQTAILKQRTRSNSFLSQEVLQESNLQLCEVEANRDLIQEKQDGNTSKDSGELRTFSEPEDASPSHSPVEMSSCWGQAEVQQALTDGEEGEQERTAAAGDHLLHEDKKGVMEKRSEAERSSGSEPNVTALVNTKRSRLSNKEQGILEGQSIFQWRTSKPTGPSASAEETQKKDTAMINLTRHEKEKYIPSDELSSASAAGDQKEKPALETRKERARTSHGKASQAHDLKAFLINQDAHKNCQVKLSVSSSSSAMELSADNEEDMYRDAEEIEREKVLPVCETGFSENKLSVAAEMDIIEYCQKEWRGSTPMAKLMKKGYEAVSQKFTSIRRVRGDNYCALRATLFQALSQASELPDWLQSEDLTLLPEKLLSKYDWIKQWQLRQKLGRRMGELSNEIKDYLILLRKKWEIMSEMKTPVERQAACDELFTNEEEEYSLYEAVKFLMLNTAIELYDDDKKGKKVPVFSWLLFARDTSSNPSQLMNNHLNQIGHTGGLEQVEMFLLAYALQYTIRVYRLYKYSTDEFITLYPNDPEEDWPMVTLLTEDDRHYNIPVRMCEETSL